MMKKIVNIFDIRSNSNVFRSIFFIVLGLVLIYIISYFVFKITINQFVILEENELETVVIRFEENNNAFIHDALISLIDYSEWDDSYEYINNHNYDYIYENYSWDYFESNLGMNLIAITDLSGNPIFIDSYDVEVGSLDIENINYVNNDYLDSMIQNYEMNNEQYTYISTDYGLMLVLINPVTDTYQTLETNGYMFFGVLIDDEVLQKIARLNGLDSVTIINEVDQNSFIHSDNSEVSMHYHLLLEDEIVVSYQIDIIDSSFMFYDISWARTIYQTGLTSAIRVRNIVAGSLIIIMFSAFYIINLSLISSRRMKKIVITDFLTKLYNRRYFEEKIDEISSAKERPISIIMGDINGLKLANDAFGHVVGDKLILKVSEILKANVSESDIVARIGGDEFAIILYGDEKVSESYIKSVQESCSNYFIEGIMLSISFGYAISKNIDDDFYDLIRSAEDAMYRQKLLEIPSMRSNAIESIIQTLYEKDPISEEHSRRVSDYGLKISEILDLNFEDKSTIRTAGLLHDIGKIIVSSKILKKKGLLDDDEFDNMKLHPEIGFRILNSISGLREISKIVLSHHEKWDGTGYPQKISKTEIPFLSRIITIADAFDAMTSIRSYKEKITKEEAFEEIIKCSGKHFDPDIVNKLIENKEEFLKNID